MRSRNHLLVVGELALDDLGDDLDSCEGEARLVGTDRERDRLVGIAQELDQLEHRLARQDRFYRAMVAPERAAGVGQAVAVRCHDAQHVLVDGEEHPVEVIADVLNRHGELHEPERVLQRLLRQRECLRGVTCFHHAREIAGGQRLEVEPALAGAHRHAAFLCLERHLHIVGQRTQDVVELPRAGRDRAFGRTVDVRFGGDLDFQVGREKLDLGSGGGDQDVGEYRQGMAALDDAGNLLQGAQEFFVCRFDFQHDLLPIFR